MLVRSILLTSHKWRELVFFGRLVCKCHTSFSGVTFVLFCFPLLFFCLYYAFVGAAALRSNRPSMCRRPDSHTCFFIFFPFVYLEMSLFPNIFLPFPLFLCMETTSFVLPSRMVFFYPVTTGCIFDISLFM